MYIIFGIIIGFFVLMMVSRFLLLAKMKKMKGKEAPELPGKAGEAISSGKAALFYFHSPSCGACRAMTPVVTDMAKKDKNVFSVDVSRDFETARKFGIMATPTTIIVKSGVVKDLLIGPQPESILRASLN